MVAYLIFAGIFLTLGICGFLYAIFSDVFDIVLPISQSNTYVLQHLTATDTNFVGDFLIFLAKFFPIWIVIGVLLYVLAKSQKPETSY